MGMLLGFVMSFQGLEGQNRIGAGRWFSIWIVRPDWYWPWPSFGVVIAWPAFYLMRLLKT